MESWSVVLLGATGFVGRAVRRAVARHPEVAVRMLVRGDTGRIEAGTGVVIPGELPDVPSALFPEGPFVVVHFATRQIDTGSGFDDVNVRGTARLLDALSGDCRAILYGSSLSVYGQGPQRGEREDLSVNPETALARSRAEAERLVLAAAERRSITAHVLRPRFVVGTGDAFTLPALRSLFSRGIAIGEETQAFTIIDVDDYAEAIVRLARRAMGDGPAERGALHVGYEKSVELREIRAEISKHHALPRPRFRLPMGAGALRLWRRALGASALLTRLELVAQDHFVDVGAFGARVGTDLVGRAPGDVIERAARALAGAL